MSSISINNEILLERYKEQKLIRNQQQIDRINKLIKDLLNLSKLENNSIEFHFQRLPIIYLLDLTIENIYSIKKEKEIIYNNIKGDIYCDESWIIEAFSNILKNSLEQESVTKIRIKSIINDQYLKIVIQDNGNGFNEQDIKNVFKRFYKGKNSNKDSNGIGMSLAKEIIRNHHGFIEVYNNQGACIEIIFPILNIREKFISES